MAWASDAAMALISSRCARHSPRCRDLRHHQPRALALGWAYRPEYVGSFCALILGGSGSGAAAGPAARKLILLTNAGLVLPPKLYAFAAGLLFLDFRHEGGKVSLNPSMASGS